MIFGNTRQAGPWLTRVRLALIFLVVIPCFSLDGLAASRSDIFPEYEVIQPNVDFWVSIFSQYSQSQGVVHDAIHLDIVYEIIDLVPGHTAKSKRINRARKKKTYQKYKTILRSLARKKPPGTLEEKRVAALFGHRNSPNDFQRAVRNIRCQKGLKDQFKQGLVRAAPYIEGFKKTLSAHGVPQDLVYLPCVESSYNFKAYSRFGAAGIWQFTRSTGRRYMTIDYVVDERRDPYISTRAAARLLKKNYDMAQNWPMAITAYNHGLAGILRAKKKHGSYENIFKNYRSRTFKFASRNFYSEFLAARKVARKSRDYFGEIQVPDVPGSKGWRLKGYAPVKALAAHLGVSVNEIRTLNPALRKPVFSGQKYIPQGYKLWLPSRVSDKTLADLPAAVFRTRQKPSRFHRVEPGDTAGKIARVHGVRLNDLILANNLNRRATIYIGQNLRIPVDGAPEPVKPKTVPVKVAVTKPEPVPPVPEKPAAPPEVTTAVALKPGTITPDIVIGHLKVDKTWEQKGKKMGRIRIEAEETLGHIAMWANVPTQNIRRLNHLTYGQPIGMDRELTIPLSVVSRFQFEEKRYEYHMGLEEDFFSSFEVAETTVHEVKSGDNLWTLCMKKFEVPVWLMKKYNPGIQFNGIKPGQKIIFPVIAEGPDAALIGQ